MGQHLLNHSLKLLGAENLVRDSPRERRLLVPIDTTSDQGCLSLEFISSADRVRLSRRAFPTLHSENAAGSGQVGRLSAGWMGTFVPSHSLSAFRSAGVIFNSAPNK